MANEIATTIVAGVMSGGLVSAAAAAFNARANRATSKVAEQKAPVEINLSSIEGAEKAVLSLGKALDAANAHAEQLEADLHEKVEEVRQLRRECQRLREQLQQAKAALRHYLSRKDPHGDQGLLDGLSLDEG